MPVDISILIVNFNGERVLAPCLDSLFAHPPQASYEVIVVDNASSDKSVEQLSSYTQDITLIQNTQNRGFSYANNQAVKQAKGAFFFFLNNDTLLLEGTLTALWSFAKQHPKLGIVGPQLLNVDHSLQRQGSWLGQWQYGYNGPKKVSFVVGAAMMIPRHVYEEVGGFDEAFFFYNEDIDLCKMIAKKGYSIYFYPAAKLIHVGGHSSKLLSDRARIEGFRGGLYLVKKHYAWVFPLYRFFILILSWGAILFCPSLRLSFYEIARITWRQTLRYPG